MRSHTPLQVWSLRPISPFARRYVMNDATVRNLTGVLLILTPIAFNVFFTLLSMIFEYPDILREDASYVLREFDAGGSELVAIWYGFMLTAVLFIPLAVLVHKVLARQDTPYLAVATAFGVVAANQEMAGRVGDGVGRGHPRRHARTCWVRTSRRHRGGRVPPVVSLARGVRHLPPAFSPSRERST